MLRIISVALLMVGLTACNEPASLQTQASAQAQVVANEYRLFINFKQANQNQETLMKLLQDQTAHFISWFKQGFSEEQLVGENIRLQPLYEYPKHQVRQLVSYEGSQQFSLIGLSFEQYNQLMKELPTFKSESFGLQSVQASEEALTTSRGNLVEEAFAKNQAKAQHLAKLSELCELKVVEIKEYDQGGGQPRMMSMRMKEDSNAPSQHSHSVRMEVTWSAHPC
jgi:uncharacterized protein YggE